MSFADQTTLKGSTPEITFYEDKPHNIKFPITESSLTTPFELFLNVSQRFMNGVTASSQCFVLPPLSALEKMRKMFSKFVF